MDGHIEQMPQDPFIADTKEDGLFEGYRIQRLRVAGGDRHYPFVGSDSLPAPASRQATIRVGTTHFSGQL